MDDELRRLNFLIENLHQKMSQGSDVADEIERLEFEAAEIIRANADSTLVPLQLRFDEAIRLAHSLLADDDGNREK